MTIRLITSLVFMIFVAGCAKQIPSKEQVTAEGLLKHFPSDVKSSQAWHGHNFMVGNTPVIPTDAVPETKLKSHVGKLVIVTGIWHDGQQWQPKENEKKLSIPANPENQIIIRGDGLKVSTIRLIKK